MVVGNADIRRRDTADEWPADHPVDPTRFANLLEFIPIKPSGGTGSTIEVPCAHMHFDRGLKAWDQALKLIQGDTNQIEYLCWARLHVDKL